MVDVSQQDDNDNTSFFVMTESNPPLHSQLTIQYIDLFWTVGNFKVFTAINGLLNILFINQTLPAETVLNVVLLFISPIKKTGDIKS